MNDTRRAREVARIREDILASAARAFAQHGPRGTTIQEVAREAGYAPAALYSYFNGKDEIFSGIIEGLAEKVFGTFEQPVPAGLTFQQRLEILFQRQCEVAEANKYAYLVFIINRAQLAPVDSTGGDIATFDRYQARLSAWFENESAPSDLACSAADAACAFVGISQAFFGRWLKTGGEQRFSEQAATIVALFLHGVQNDASPTEHDG